MRNAKRRDFSDRKSPDASNPENDIKEKKSLNELSQHIKNVNDANASNNKSYAQTRKMLSAVSKQIAATHGGTKTSQHDAAKDLAGIRVALEGNERLKKDERKKLMKTLNQAEKLIGDQGFYLRSLSLEKLKKERTGVDEDIKTKKTEAKKDVAKLKEEANTQAHEIIESAKKKAGEIVAAADNEANERRSKTAQNIKNARNKNKDILIGRNESFTRVQENWRKRRDEDEAHFKERKDEFHKQVEDHKLEHKEKMDQLKEQRKEFVEWRKKKRKETAEELKLKRKDFREKKKLRETEHKARLKKIRDEFKEQVRAAKNGIRENEKKYKLKRDKGKKYFNELKENFLNESPVIGMIHDAFQGVRGLLARKENKEAERHLENIDKNMERLVREAEENDHEGDQDRLNREKSSLSAAEADREKKFGANRVAANDPTYAQPQEEEKGSGGGIVSGIVNAIAGSLIVNKARSVGSWVAGKAVGAAKTVGTVGKDMALGTAASKGGMMGAATKILNPLGSWVAGKAVGAAKTVGTVGKDMALGTAASKGGMMGAATKILNPLGSALEAGGKLAKVGKVGLMAARATGIVNMLYSVYAIGDGVINAERMFGRKIEKTDIVRRMAGGIIGFMSSWVELIDIVSFGNTNFKEKFEKAAGSFVDGYMKFYGDVWEGIKKGSMTDIVKAFKDGFVKLLSNILDLIPLGGKIKDLLGLGDKASNEPPKPNRFTNPELGPVSYKAQSVQAKKAELNAMKQNEAAQQRIPFKSNNVVDNSVKNNTTNVINSKLSTRNYDTSMYDTLYGPGRLGLH